MRIAIVACLPLLIAGCASRSANAPAKPAPTAAAGPATPGSTPASAPASGARAQRPSPADDADDADDDGAPAGRAERREAPPLRPYNRVITKEATTDPGVFTVHRVRERVYYEIPKAMLGREFLWVSQIASTAPGVGFGGQAAGNRVVRWERRDRRVLLRSVSYEMWDPLESTCRHASLSIL